MYHYCCGCCGAEWESWLGTIECPECHSTDIEGYYEDVDGRM